MPARSEKEILYDVFLSPLGLLYLAFKGDAIAEITFSEKPSLAIKGFKKGNAPSQVIQQLSDYFKGILKKFDLEVFFLKGTDFEKAVWLTLREIPYGETKTYKWIAERIGKPKAARAVGRALSKNPIPIILPCHRVIESNGSMGGYSAGIEKKRRLLHLEYFNQLADNGKDNCHTEYDYSLGSDKEQGLPSPL